MKLNKLPTLKTLHEGDFGPGTIVELKLQNKNFKAQLGAIENKHRPEAVYITISSWFIPKISAKASLTNGEVDAHALGRKLVREFEVELRRAATKFAGVFDSSIFDQSGFIFSCDVPDDVKPGKKMFFEMEINIDTMNNIDNNGRPTPSSDGKTYKIPFGQIVQPATKAINRILMNSIFQDSEIIEFSLRKG